MSGMMKNEIVYISLSDIHTEDAQFSEDRALTDSIKACGIIEPLIVRENGGDDYTLLAGKSRFCSAHSAGLKEVPCIVYPSENSKLIQENLTYDDICHAKCTPKQLADAYNSKIKEFSKMENSEERKEFCRTHHLPIPEVPEISARLLTAVYYGVSDSRVQRCIAIGELNDVLLDAYQRGCFGSTVAAKLGGLAQEKLDVLSDIYASGAVVKISLHDFQMIREAKDDAAVTVVIAQCTIRQEEEKSQANHYKSKKKNQTAAPTQPVAALSSVVTLSLDSILLAAGWKMEDMGSDEELKKRILEKLSQK